MKFQNLALLAVVVATLVACGGGGSDTPAANPTPIAAGPADKYVGTWGNCQSITGGANGIVSVRSDFVFTKTAPAAMSLSVNGVGFTGANCSGNTVNPLNGLATATVTLNGTKLIGTDTVDRWDIVGTSQAIPELNGQAKEIGFISGNTLKLSSASVVDPQGYPTALDNFTVFTKR